MSRRVLEKVALALFLVVSPSLATNVCQGAQLLVGAASTSITPKMPVALQGQRHVRISTGVESPCLATVVALESREGQKTVDQAIFASLDLTFIPEELSDAVHAKLKPRLADFDVNKLIMSATHTHTAPVLTEGAYILPKEGIMQPAEYLEFAVGRICDAIVEAWNRRQPGAIGYGLGHAVVGRNRLAVYADGTAQMYGQVNRPDFVRFEGYEDHGVEVLFFWTARNVLIATAVNVACPAQEVEGRTAVNADFWHNVREQLKARHGADLQILAWNGPGGDQSPHPLLRKAAEKRMQRLRNITSMDEIARRIVDAWEEAYDGAKHDKRLDAQLVHHVETIKLPKRQVTQEEMLAAKVKADSYAGNPDESWNHRWNQRVVDRFNTQKPDDTYETPLHVVRLGDVAIATNDFELYTDYGIRMKARSRAIQTFLLQLSGPGTYLPADRSIAGNAYGAVVQSGVVGPEGGKVLVEKTVAAINALFPDVAVIGEPVQTK